MNPDVALPGTSDALFARTIDATVHPPLVRAQETAAALVPRVAEAVAPLASPLVLGALLLTLVFTWAAIRMRFRPSALVLGALLVMTLSSFNPVQKPEQKSEPSRVADVRTPRTTVGGVRPSHRTHVYVQPPQAEAPEVYVHVDPMPVYLPPDFAERLPDWSKDAMHSAERMVRENEQIRQMMRQIRYRLREEARRQHWRQMVAERKARSREFNLIESP